mmetsp:Transcript_39226/g.66867  ORF Transcript_39226/g.66867 Transcript_39226/m.66867 type:complete len:206 (+) Transcript_39226:771-1388(+)
MSNRPRPHGNGSLQRDQISLRRIRHRRRPVLQPHGDGHILRAPHRGIGASLRCFGDAFVSIRIRVVGDVDSDVLSHRRLAYRFADDGSDGESYGRSYFDVVPVIGARYRGTDRDSDRGVLDVAVALRRGGDMHQQPELSEAVGSSAGHRSSFFVRLVGGVLRREQSGGVFCFGYLRGGIGIVDNLLRCEKYDVSPHHTEQKNMHE